MEKRKFDFESEEFLKHDARVQHLLKSLYGTATSLEEFCAKMKEIKPTATPPSYLKNYYERLIRNYEFFS